MESTETATQTAIAEKVTTESAPVEEVEAQGETAEAPKETAEQGSQPTKENKVDVKELIAERKKKQEAKQEAAYWKGRAESVLQPVKPEAVQQPVSTQGAPVEPVSDNYDTWDGYEKAHARWVIDVAKHEMRQEQIAEQVNQRLTVQQKEQQKLRDTFESRIEKAAEIDSSILSLIEDDTLPVHKSALDIIYESDIPAELLQALNKDRKEATRIFHLFNTNPVMAAREFGKLEAKLQLAPKPIPPKKVSAAPDPIPTVKGTSSGIVDDLNLPVDQWIARRNKAEFRR